MLIDGAGDNVLEGTEDIRKAVFPIIQMDGYGARNGRLGQGQGCTNMKSDRETDTNRA